jgi:hypothetical protein
MLRRDIGTLHLCYRICWFLAGLPLTEIAFSFQSIVRAQIQSLTYGDLIEAVSCEDVVLSGARGLIILLRPTMILFDRPQGCRAAGSYVGLESSIDLMT